MRFLVVVVLTVAVVVVDPVHQKENQLNSKVEIQVEIWLIQVTAKLWRNLVS